MFSFDKDENGNLEQIEQLNQQKYDKIIKSICISFKHWFYKRMPKTVDCTRIM
jgi:hypothetical protein